MNTGFGVSGLLAAPVFGFIVEHGSYPAALGFSALLLALGLVLTTRIRVRALDEVDVG